eukprot:Gb_35537 [translate_table: standard]
MGKLNWETQLLHFSHAHLLQLTNLEGVGGGHHECHGCKSPVSGWIYRCNLCNYDLHQTCSQIPQQITHPIDTHVLNLLAQPAYEGGYYMCNACCQKSKGFSFHCSLCQIDLHPSCATLPLNFNHPNHSHTLKLCFTPPYPDKAFCCDICNKPGKDSWHYHCSQCLFDLHVPCTAKTTPTSTSNSASVPKASSQYNREVPLRAAPSPAYIRPIMNAVDPISQISSLVSVPGRLLNQIFQSPNSRSLYRPSPRPVMMAGHMSVHQSAPSSGSPAYYMNMPTTPMQRAALINNSPVYNNYSSNNRPAASSHSHMKSAINEIFDAAGEYLTGNNDNQGDPSNSTGFDVGDGSGAFDFSSFGDSLNFGGLDFGGLDLGGL